MLRVNKEVIENSNKGLGRTKTVKMKRDTSDHPPVKLSRYRTIIYKTELVDKITKLLAYLLPLINDILVLLGKDICFSILFKVVYLQATVNKADRENTAFGCHMGLYQFRIILFRLAGATDDFQQLMSCNIILSERVDFVMSCINDVLMFCRDTIALLPLTCSV